MRCNAMQCNTHTHTHTHYHYIYLYIHILYTITLGKPLEAPAKNTQLQDETCTIQCQSTTRMSFEQWLLEAACTNVRSIVFLAHRPADPDASFFRRARNPCRCGVPLVVHVQCSRPVPTPPASSIKENGAVVEPVKACQMRMNLGPERICCMRWVHVLACAMALGFSTQKALTGDTWILPWKVRVGL